MKRRFSKLVRFFCLLVLVSSLAPNASAQTRLTLVVKFSGGQPTVNLKGEMGTVYSIQYATGLSPVNQWTDRTLLQARAVSVNWSDPSAFRVRFLAPVRYLLLKPFDYDELGNPG